MSCWAKTVSPIGWSICCSPIALDANASRASPHGAAVVIPSPKCYIPLEAVFGLVQADVRESAMRPPILQDDISYTFADYFHFNIDIEELLTHFGYTYQVTNYCLPHSTRTLDRLNDPLALLKNTCHMSVSTGCDRSPSGVSCCHWEFNSLRHTNRFDVFSVRI